MANIKIRKSTKSGGQDEPRRGDMFVAVGKPKAQPAVREKMNRSFEIESN